MPQIGHDPGASRTISGCMGQTYSVLIEGDGAAGSRLMPHFGHAPGLDSRISGSIGQMYAVSDCADCPACAAGYMCALAPVACEALSCLCSVALPRWWWRTLSGSSLNFAKQC